MPDLIAQPNKVSLQLISVDGPNAQPGFLQASNGSLVKYHVIGGLSKLQEAALRIAAAKPTAPYKNFYGDDAEKEKVQNSHIASLSVQCVDLAQAIISECDRRERTAQTNGRRD